jgi:hypothetical protein
VAGTGVPQGTNFTFTVAGRTVTVPAGPGPTGFCSSAIEVPAGTVTVTETVPAGFQLVSCRTVPPELFGGLSGNTATVTVRAGGIELQTILICTDIRVTGFLQICKVAGDGVTVGTNFTFTVDGRTVTVPAGPGPTGFCSSAIEVPAGTVRVTETVPAGFQLVSCRTVPPELFGGLSDSTATVTVRPGGIELQTILICTNIRITGILKICKVAGPGVDVGQLFTFTVSPAPIAGTGSATVTVPAGAGPGGTCVIVGEFPHSTVVTITETLPVGIATSFTIVPASEARTCPPDGPNVACAHISGGLVTEVTFTNVVVAPGILKICKVAGTGITVGGLFTFNVSPAPIAGTGSATVQVPAGPAPGGFCVIVGSFPASTVVTITETLLIGLAPPVTAVVPAGEARICPPGTPVNSACAHVSGFGLVTEVTFTNRVLGP